jgi:hypothetical protein
MTINLNRTPNSLHLRGDVTIGVHFGAVLSVTPIVLAGEHHTPHLVARLASPTGSIVMELCPATASELARGITKGLVSMPFHADDVRDAVSGE